MRQERTSSPQTYFASPERVDDELIRIEIDVTSHNSIIDGLLRTVGGLLAVLNEHRQILAFNDSLLRSLGIDDANKMLGLRPGEAINCIHAHEMPGGCGTSKFCSSCGAAIAIVTSMETDKSVERFCVATVKKENKEADICFQVRSCPIKIEGRRFILLFLQDCTAQQQNAAFTRTFFHDIMNIVSGLQAISDLIDSSNRKEEHELIDLMHFFMDRLTTEIKIQKTLFQIGDMNYQPKIQEISVREVVQDIKNLYAVHPLAQGKRLSIPDDIGERSFQSDHSLLLRILSNMMTNAFEATDAGDEVKFWVEFSPQSITFSVLNRQAIPPEVGRRIFQRNFSTKTESGRGLGTFAMKLFGEEILGGKVGFTSAAQSGTVFSFSHPA